MANTFSRNCMLHQYHVKFRNENADTSGSSVLFQLETNINSNASSVLSMKINFLILIEIHTGFARVSHDARILPRKGSKDRRDNLRKLTGS